MGNGRQPEELIDQAIELVDSWLRAAEGFETRRSRATMEQLKSIIVDQASLDFVMAFIDRVARPDDNAVAAQQLHALIESSDQLPDFLGSIDKLLLRSGSVLAPKLPSIVIPLARQRMRAIVGHLVAPADPKGLASHLADQQEDGWASNVNLLGEAVLGDAEADRRLATLLELLKQPDVDYVSVKLSSVAAQLNPWAWDDSLAIVTERLTRLVDQASATAVPTFINLDMEEYHDLEITLEAFEAVLGAPERRHIEAGIVLQAYLPDALPALQRLSVWAAARVDQGGAPIKVRLVKGANLAMEKVDAAMHGWVQAPYDTKADTDANYMRCVDWVLNEEHMTGLRIGLASHNLFHVAFTSLLAESRGVAHKVQFEMLQGMAEAQASAVAADTKGELRPLLYTPAVDASDFDVAIGYLFRRLEENAAEDNFLRSLFDLAPASPTFKLEGDRFRASIADRNDVSVGPRRTQDQLGPVERAFEPGQPFQNEPETDPSLPTNRAWAAAVQTTPAWIRKAAPINDEATVDDRIEKARLAQVQWAATSADKRREVLHRVGDELAKRRTLLVSTMADECGKTIAESDVELCEAIDFARYYGERTTELGKPGLSFKPLGVVSVIPPWNFPVAIPCGGVLSSLAATNAVLFKPAPEASRCGELIHESLMAAGVPADLVPFFLTNDGDAGRRVVQGGDAVILTGSSETADLFQSWNPSMRLFAETSGKNALVITPKADVDLAVDDLVRSAFGHAGQKCSAASLGILVGSLATSDRFHRQLVDAVQTLAVGPPEDLRTTMGPLISEANDRLERAFSTLDAGEKWLVEPRLIDGERNLWSPGVRTGVKPGSWFHQTECFGPVLGLIYVDTLDEAIAIQNGSDFGLTGGIHTLDPAEIEQWVERVEVGNAYINRHITGAIVERQPFGGWKRSSVGPGAKAGGPNYVTQLGTWHANDASTTNDYAEAWATRFSVEHDPSGLFCESNVFRYRPLDKIVLRFGPDASDAELSLFRAAAKVAGVSIVESDAAAETWASLAGRLESIGAERIRAIGTVVEEELRAVANAQGIHIADQPVVPFGEVELLHLVREQSISRTMHRFGNLIAA